MLGRTVEGSPVAPLIAFSAATNLGLAGRTFRFDGGPALAEALRRLLVGFGAREAEEAELVLAGDVDAAAAAAPPGAIVVGVGPQRPAPEGAVLARSGVETAAGGVLVVREVPRSSAGSAADRLDWARARMPASRAAVAELGDRARGRRIAISMVLEPKTAVLALLLAEAGADVAVFAFAAETDDAVAAELAARGIAVAASSAATPAEERRQALALLDRRPHVLVDDGAHLIRLAHAERPEAVAALLGASEETTSGVTPLRAMAGAGGLAVPVLAANDAVTKSWFDNRHGTGETCVLAIVRALDHDLAGARVAVVGFGPVGEGVAQRAAALGAAVIVVDLDPRRELAARFAGHSTGSIGDAVRDADLVISATGAPGTIDAAVLAACAEDAVLAVAGGAPEEVRLPDGTTAVPIGPHVERLLLPGGRSVRLLAGGDCVNIVAGEGNPIDVMDLSFAVQLAAVKALLESDGALAPGVHPLPEAADRHAAALALGRDGASSTPPAPVDWRRTRFDV